jgi:hypothetical protein
VFDEDGESLDELSFSSLAKKEREIEEGPKPSEPAA